MRGAAIFAVVVATLFAFAGVLQLSQATTGVGLIAFACFIAIGARLMQASGHHERAVEALALVTPKPQRPPPPEDPPYVRPENIEQVAKQYGVSTRP